MANNLRACISHRPSRSRLCAAILTLAYLLISMTPTYSVQTVKAAGTIPVGLPNHFTLGLANGPGNTNWMTGSGVPWDMRYQYLSGGANTGGGWATWNTNGDFATYYMNNSAQNRYIPVFTYYQLLQSAPATGANEQEKDYNNLNNAATMHAYFADFRLLMDKAGAYGKPVIVHVEPDLFGFMHQRVIDGTNSASAIPAKVAASDHAEAAGLPDTFQGFNWALLRMRDRYAPNVILAAHVSHWSAKVDIGTSTSATLDVAGLAQKTAVFHNTAGISGNPAGVSSYDLIFFDPSDRDAAYYQYVWNDGGAHWWDMSNQRFPNFARYAQYIKYVSDGTGRRAMLWQVPIGNTHFRTMNNTDGHFQDNRAQYFLGGYPNDGRIAEYANAGVIGILFGRGAGGPTTYEDAKGDGVTNPAAINGNDAVSQHADDDGGYLRIVAGRYYQAGAYRFDNTISVSPTPSSSPAPTMTTTRTIAAAADTYVSSKRSNQNYGKATTFSADGSPTEQGFVRFDTGSLSGAVVSAKLRLFVTDGSVAAGGKVQRISSTTWSETSMTYQSRPAIDGVHVGSLNATTAGTWVEYDISTVVTGQGSYSFGITQTGGDNVGFASRENATSSQRPQLVVTTQ